MTLVRLLLTLLLLGLPAGAQAQTFPALTGRVVDAAELLSPEQEAQLTQLSEGIEKASGRQFVVATVPDLQGHPIEDYGYRLGTAWKLGQAEAHNGIILLVAPKERAVRIEVGKGLEPLVTDGLAGLIIDDLIVPRFRAGDMAGGILAGAAEIGEQMKLPLEAAEARAKQKLDAARAARAARSSRRGDDGDVGGLVGLFWVVVFFAIVVPMIFAGRRRGRRYRGGIAPIILWSALDAATRGGRSWGGGGSSWGSGGGSSWSGGGGFSGGGGSFGGGGASGSW